MLVLSFLQLCSEDWSEQVQITWQEAFLSLVYLKASLVTNISEAALVIQRWWDIWGQDTVQTNTKGSVIVIMTIHELETEDQRDLVSIKPSL